MRDIIIIKVKYIYKKSNKYIFELEVITKVKEALAIEKREGNIFWQDVINKEMKN